MKSELKTLANGMRILAIPRAHSNLQVFKFFINVGAKNETKENNGISHLLEHMLYEGTQKFPGKRFLETFDDLGIFPDGVTNSSHTKFCCSFLKNDAEKVMELMADMLQHPLLPANKLRAEKKIISKENAELRQDFQFHMKYMEAAFGVEPYLSNPCGEEEVIQKLSIEDVRAHWRKFYTGPNILLVASGGMEAEEVFALAEKYFAELNPQKTEQPQPRPFRGGAYFHYRIPDKVNLVSLDFYASDDNDRFAATLLAHILGGGLSSLLMKKLRSKQNLVYGVTALTERHYYGNIFDVSAECFPQDAPAVLESIKGILEQVCRRKISKALLERAKKKLCFDFALGSSLDEARCDYYGENLLIKNAIIDEDEFNRRMNAVTCDDILATARRIFTTNAVLITQGKKSAPYNELKKVFDK